MKLQKQISIIIITWNSQEKLPKCLKLISRQLYPKDKIQIIIVDGGSTDKTFEIANSYKSIFKKFKLIKTSIKDPEPKRAIGVKEAYGEYICFIDPDNYITNNNWINQMIKPLEQDKSITGSQTLYYQYNKNESLINRYFALFGVNDPIVFYLGKADRIPHFERKWLFNSQYKDCGDYFKVTFQKNIPTMGANGVIYKKQHYIKAISTPESYFHIDIIQDLVDLGYCHYAIIKNDVLHSTSSSFSNSIKKRIGYMNIHYFQKQINRHYFVFNPKLTNDRVNLIKFIIYTLTLIQPLYLSVKGFIKIKDIAWFLHWPMCFGFLCAYGYATITNKLFLKKSNLTS